MVWLVFFFSLKKTNNSLFIATIIQWFMPKIFKMEMLPMVGRFIHDNLEIGGKYDETTYDILIMI